MLFEFPMMSSTQHPLLPQPLSNILSNLELASAIVRVMRNLGKGRCCKGDCHRLEVFRSAPTDHRQINTIAVALSCYSWATDHGVQVVLLSTAWISLCSMGNHS